MCHGYVACACIMCMWHVLGLGWSCGAQVVSDIECGRWGGRPQLRALPLFGVGVCGVCVGLEHRVWPVVGASHKQLKPLACFRARVVVWGSGGLGYRVWPVGGAGHSSGLSLSSVRGPCVAGAYVRPASLLAVVGRWTATARRSSFSAASRRGDTCGDLGMWSEKGMQAVCSVQDVL
jgi:hypothetical protein